MNRRNTIKVLGLGAISATTILEACKNTPAKTPVEHPVDTTGRQDFEITRDKSLTTQTFFDPHEMAAITLLADIIIPRDEKSGSATDAGVPDFIEFIVKDEPQHQLPMRGGLRWLDTECLSRFEKDFTTCTPEQRLEVLNDIAYPFTAKPHMQPGVTFFNKIRDLTAIGFFTSKIGIEDLGYKGNTPGQWNGVPPEVLKQYGL
jgi:gluconate 2-dehydrogenase gamma chain